MRYCTADLKRGPISHELRRLFPSGSVICAMGLHAQESQTRARRPAFSLRTDSSAPTKGRFVYDWLLIHDWTETDVWDCIRRHGDVRIEDFRHTAWAMLRAQSGLDDLKTAAAYANGVHSWQGRMAYALLHAVEYLTLAAVHLLLHGDEHYIREKLQSGLQRITGALYEGVRNSRQPSLYNFKGTYFPDERDTPTKPR